MIEFWLGLLLALAAGTAQFSEGSAMDSQDPTPFVQYAASWPCDVSGDVETCFAILDPAGLHTGP